MELTLVLVFLLVFLSSVWFIKSRRHKTKNRLPGPRSGWPLIGYAPVFSYNRKLYQQLTLWRKEYGDLYSFDVLGRTIVIVCNPKLIREMLVKHAHNFSHRPKWMALGNEILNDMPSTIGLVWNKEDWKTSRKFALTALRDFGLGKSLLEDMVRDEIEALTLALDKECGRPVNLATHLVNAVSDVICSIVFGNRFDYKDPDFLRMMDNFHVMFSAFFLKKPFNLQPWTLKVVAFLFKPFSRTEEIKAHMDIDNFIRSKIKTHKESYDVDVIRDFIDLYIDNEVDGGTKYGQFDGETFIAIIIELFAAGTETSATTLNWMILYMIHHPEIQAKCREEIHQKIGIGRFPKMTDRTELPYTEAMLNEVQRIATIAPLSLPHTALEDCDVGGYIIPKDAMIFPNLFEAHRHPDIWENPEDFKPERWINGDGLVDSKHDDFIPFSLGRRACLGEQLARMEVWMFSVSLLQRFTFSPVDPGNLPTLDGVHGMTLMTAPYECIVKKV